MSKKDAIFNPYRPGDENHLYFSDPLIIRYSIKLAKLAGLYFRYEVDGFGNIPQKTGAILAANHGILPLDLFLLSSKLYKRRKKRVRILVHRRSWDIPVFREAGLNLGLVGASQENAVRLLKRKEIVCVFPGGEREGLKSSRHKYELRWGGRMGFVKTAILAGVPIVPCMSVGIDDLFHVMGGPLPLFFGMGPVPFPVKIKHWIGKPIRHGLKPADARKTKLVQELHAHVWAESEKLLKKGLKRQKIFGLLA